MYIGRSGGYFPPKFSSGSEVTFTSSVLCSVPTACVTAVAIRVDEPYKPKTRIRDQKLRPGFDADLLFPFFDQQFSVSGVLAPTVDTRPSFRLHQWTWSYLNLILFSFLLLSLFNSFCLHLCSMCHLSQNKPLNGCLAALFPELTRTFPKVNWSTLLGSIE